MQRLGYLPSLDPVDHNLHHSTVVVSTLQVVSPVTRTFVSCPVSPRCLASSGDTLMFYLTKQSSASPFLSGGFLSCSLEDDVFQATFVIPSYNDVSSHKTIALQVEASVCIIAKTGPSPRGPSLRVSSSSLANVAWTLNGVCGHDDHQPSGRSPGYHRQDLSGCCLHCAVTAAPSLLQPQ